MEAGKRGHKAYIHSCLTLHGSSRAIHAQVLLPVSTLSFTLLQSQNHEGKKEVSVLEEPEHLHF